MSIVEDSTAIPKAEHSDLESFSESSPEPDDPHFIQEVAQTQKRKGGRKPIYATSEERKQRNRQAQAAFRERRTEYIKQLETTIKHHEETLQTLQQSHRSAADECLMLRYKNSLLERILLEKGIDVQTELRSKTDHPQISPHGQPSATHQPPPIQRAVINRHTQARRSTSGIMKISHAHPSPTSTLPKQSPQLQPTPPSQALSPTTSRSPVGLVQGGTTPVGVDLRAQQQQQPRPKSRIPPSYMPSSISTSMSGPNIDSVSTEQEYDAHADMLDETDPSEHSADQGPAPYPPIYQQAANHGHSMGMQGQPPMQPMQPLPPLQPMHPPAVTQIGEPNHAAMGEITQPFDPFDPMLDADPFGLTASMHFPTQFTFQESSMRQ
ncbi:MAG: hypothetical protein HETSPECPRED_002684 [Heterodermia speciosa]|uniref:BZIP domain-containing protein n=1 Tax=Heterodermia speciosa TaxID=116794 RepID=A0A8H3J595_9LECA|nr:MAG: hypothetical protein HETSPECPRED_002684 [Heterodermia speciosa]